MTWSENRPGSRMAKLECNTAFVLADGTRLSALEPEKARRGFGPRRTDQRHGGLQSGVSCCTFFLAEIAVELAV